MSDSLWPHRLQHARPPVHHQLLEFTQTQVHWVDDAYSICCRPLLLLPSIFPSIRVFSNESALRIRWPKYWSFSFSFSPSWFPLGWSDWISLQSKELETMKKNFLEVFIDSPSISCWMVMDVCETLWDNKYRGIVNQIISRATQRGPSAPFFIKSREITLPTKVRLVKAMVFQ